MQVPKITTGQEVDASKTIEEQPTDEAQNQTTPEFGTPEYWEAVKRGEIKMTPAPMPTAPPTNSKFKDTGMAAPSANNSQYKDPGMVAPSKFRESADDILLDKMLTIAGLR
jgi:hypothetical protein